MKCHLIQTTKIADDNKAEREMLAFLKNLPEDYFLYREFKVTPAYLEQMAGIEEQRPDFITLSANTGLVAIEVKDWNLTTNIYTWIDQYNIQVERATGAVDEIPNPFNQISRYRYAFIELLDGQNVFISSILAFPCLSKAEFLNKLRDIDELRNPQSRFFFDLEKAIFKEDLDENFLKPESLLLHKVRQSPKHFSSKTQEIIQVNSLLLPDSFRIGDFSKRQANREQLRMISEDQQQWIFDLRREANYLLDVPGSGKTNVLISKAIHIVDNGISSNPRILITTYSSNLETNIRRIFSNKVFSANDRAKYREAITIQSVPSILDTIITSFYEFSSTNLVTQIGSHTPQEYEHWQREQVLEILRADPDKFKQYDYVFIDEIQDFDNFFLGVVKSLTKSDNYFFVGDIGQKIYERSYDLKRLGIVTHRIELKKSYKMYRTPKYIAELATRFVLNDPFCRQEFENYGYKGNFQFPNSLGYATEILKSPNPVQNLVGRISKFLTTHYIEDDILIISSVKVLTDLQDLLKTSNIPFSLGEPDQDGYVAIVDFLNAKGLEREIVFVTGIEDLYDRTNPVGMFWDEDKKVKRESLSRRMIYVAMTRTIEQLIIYYQDPGNRFISELVKRNKKILSRIAES